MYVTRQTRHRDDDNLSAMEYFILALIEKAGLKSLYALQQRAGLQPGGIRPALRHLEERGLIHRAESSFRNRRALSLSQDGVEFLNHNWKLSMADYPDGDSVIRAACVAILMGEPNFAGDYLVGQSLRCESAERRKKMAEERLGSGRLDPLSTYAWMRALTEAHRSEGEGIAFAALGRTLKEKQQPDVVDPRQ